jgi:uncharacterized membrane protein YdbT with pleckstrin-like domain
MLLPLVVVLVLLFLDVRLVHGEAPAGVDVLILLVLLAGVGLWAIVVWLRWTSSSFTITDQRVILDTGVLARGSRVIALDRVQDVATRQGLLGRALGYGRVEIDAAGSSGAEVLDHLPEPRRFRDEVFVQAERLRRSPHPSA